MRNSGRGDQGGEGARGVRTCLEGALVCGVGTPCEKRKIRLRRNGEREGLVTGDMDSGMEPRLGAKGEECCCRGVFLIQQWSANRAAKQRSQETC